MYVPTRVSKTGLFLRTEFSVICLISVGTSTVLLGTTMDGGTEKRV